MINKEHTYERYKQNSEADICFFWQGNYQYSLNRKNNERRHIYLPRYSYSRRVLVLFKSDSVIQDSRYLLHNINTLYLYDFFTGAPMITRSGSRATWYEMGERSYKMKTMQYDKIFTSNDVGRCPSMLFFFLTRGFHQLAGVLHYVAISILSSYF